MNLSKFKDCFESPNGESFEIWLMNNSGNIPFGEVGQQFIDDEVRSSIKQIYDIWIKSGKSKEKFYLTLNGNISDKGNISNIFNGQSCIILNKIKLRNLLLESIGI